MAQYSQRRLAKVRISCLPFKFLQKRYQLEYIYIAMLAMDYICTAPSYYKLYTTLTPDIFSSLCMSNPSDTSSKPPGSTFAVLVLKLPSSTQPGIFKIAQRRAHGLLSKPMRLSLELLFIDSRGRTRRPLELFIRVVLQKCGPNKDIRDLHSLLHILREHLSRPHHAERSPFTSHSLRSQR